MASASTEFDRSGRALYDRRIFAKDCPALTRFPVSPDRDLSAEWLSLGQACRLLGVNETTLRRWADEGRVRTFRTPGGHRRFAEADVRGVLRANDDHTDEAGSLSEAAIPGIRRRLQTPRAAAASWNQEMGDDVRTRMRLFGRRLVALIDDHIAVRGRRGRLIEEARGLGHEYGQELASGQLPLSTTVEAFAFFRRSLEEIAEQMFVRHGLTPERAAEGREHIAEVADAVLIAITRAYEERQAVIGRWSL